MFSFLHFLRAALRNPLRVSTVFQTGDKVAGLLAQSLPADTQLPVVELGVGTGAITESLLAQLQNKSVYIGLELDANMLKFAGKRFPQARFINASAETFAQYLGGQKAAGVVSSLPWTLMPPDKVEEILSSVAANLASGAALHTYITLHVLKTPAGKRVQSAIESKFSNVETTVVSHNLPPVKVFHAYL